ncbi:MAG: precorrin-2 C(20)-methyltransferase [Selenomonadaceae bacterium]|nr:precorrin-2 C(20)-methyltransferase [Selenomonadaceae bacterium]
MTKLGTFYGIGVGPGDPDLLTVKAIRAIKEVDVIIAPKTEKKEGSVALEIARPYLKSDIEIIYQVFPMVKDFAESPEIFISNKEEILKLLRTGKNVAFLTLGDPMFYSTYIYIFKLLINEKINIDTIPGVPAFLAIASKIGRPLAFGNDILSIIPATADTNDIAAALESSNTSVLMKVYKNFDQMVSTLETHEMAHNAVLVSRCGLPDEKVIEDISQHKNDKINYLSTIITRRN